MADLSDFFRRPPTASPPPAASTAAPPAAEAETRKPGPCRNWTGTLPPELDAAATAEIKRRGISRAEAVRLAIARLVGDEKLAAGVQKRTPAATGKAFVDYGNNINFVLSLVRDAGGSITAGDLAAKAGHRMTSTEREFIAGKLVAFGDLSRETEETNGRPRTVYRIPPADPFLDDADIPEESFPRTPT